MNFSLFVCGLVTSTQVSHLKLICTLSLVQLLDADNLLMNPCTLWTLISKESLAIAPMLDTTSPYSNFWCDYQRESVSLRQTCCWCTNCNNVVVVIVVLLLIWWLLWLLLWLLLLLCQCCGCCFSCFECFAFVVGVIVLLFL